MAIYRFSAQIISRSTGRSAVACAAYRAGANLADARYGERHDYSHRSGVHHTEIIAPPDTPAWMQERESLWNAVEAAEKRKDSQLAREIQLALPCELTDAERVGLVRSFVEAEFVARGMIADLAIHRPDAAGDKRNHHAHVMLTMRALTGDGFGLKRRDWNETDLLRGWREAWADHVNDELARAGLSERIDHRSHEALEDGHIPEPKLGPAATELERQGVHTRAGDAWREVRAANAERDAIAADIARSESRIIALKEEMEQLAESPAAHRLRRQQGFERKQLIDEQQQRRIAFADHRSAAQAKELADLAADLARRHAAEDARQRGDDKTGLARVLHRAGKLIDRLRDAIAPGRATARRKQEKQAAAALARARADQLQQQRDAIIARQQDEDRQARQALRRREAEERRQLAEAQDRQRRKLLEQERDRER
ncbi:MAG: MobQ family relaxase [Burkholderiaceae bacterium]